MLNIVHIIFFREPTYSISLSRNFCIKVIQKLEQIFKIQKFRIYNGDKLLKNAIKKMKHNKYIIHGLFFEWDNTPRHKKRGYVITPISHEMFINYMNNVRDEEFLFINAWNEWAEGMILEGTEENGYRIFGMDKGVFKKMKIGLMGCEFVSPNKGCEALAYSIIYILNKFSNADNNLEIYNFSGTELGEIQTEFKNIKFKNVKPKLKDYKFNYLKNLHQCDFILDATMGDSFSDIYSKKYYDRLILDKRIAMKCLKRF